MTRHISGPIVVAAVAAIGVAGVVALSILAEDGVEAEPRSTEFLPPPLTPPSFPTGEPVFENPPDPTVTDVSLVQRHGEYRIYPAGFVGTLEIETTVPFPTDVGVASSDIDVLRHSSLYVEVTSVPPDLDQYTISTGDSTSEVIVSQRFSKTADPEVHELEVGRIRRVERPVDIGAPPREGSFLTLSLELIEGHEALVWRTIEGTRPSPYTIIRFFNADLTIETIVIGDGVSEAQTLDVARSIARTGD